MARQLEIEITESGEYLEKTLKQARSASQKERLQMLWWFQIGQVRSHNELARDPSTITRWLHKYRQQGLSGLLEIKKAPGQARTITGEVLKSLKVKLNSPEGFGSYREIVSWLNENHGLDVSYRMVHYLVRYKLACKLKVPRPCSVNQDPKAIETFKKTFH
ncbi:helix-turn-helix domain-containing protein [Nostoc sp.]|uniref:helix-turn-helix domain-containing protein n=1 Tax=Nostoc sp. TaxID=1180 RepID=UPI002FF7EBD7